MKCEKCKQFLEEYIDGELERELASLMDAHITACSDCAKFYEGLRQEQELYTRYQRDIEVTPALWAGVEARIKQERVSRRRSLLAGLGERLAGLFATPRFSPALAAALVLLAVGITVLVMSLMHPANNNLTATGGPAEPQTATPNDASKPPAPKPEDKSNNLATDDGTNKPALPEKENKAAQKQLVASARPQPQKQVDPLQLVREAEQKYLRAIAILSSDVNRRRSQIDPMVLARFDSALSDIDRAINDTRRAVREHPDDPVALQYLLSAYAKKVDALREMALD